MSETEKVRLTSLDEEFDADMRAALEGAALPEAPALRPLAAGILDYLRGEYALEALEVPPAAPVGGGLTGWVRSWARRLFVSRTYHASLVTALAELEERGRQTDERTAALMAAQREHNEVVARVVFRLWGDYNHLVRSVLDHHLNEVFQHAEERIASLTDSLRDGESRTTQRVEELTAALRALEARLGEIEGPHDRMARSVAELVAGLGREETLARRIEALEHDRDSGEDP